MYKNELEELMSEVKNFFEEFEYPSYEQWKDAAIAALKGVPFDKKMYTKTYEGIRLEPIYNKKDVEDLAFANSLPGFFPFVRGTEADGYREQSWEIAQELPYACPHTFNETAKEGLKKGQTALNIKADVVWSPDNPDYKCDIPKKKLSLSSIDDMRVAFDGINLEETPVYLNSDEITYIHAGLFFAYCKEMGYDWKKVRVFFGIDPINVLAREGKLYADCDKYHDHAADLVKWAKENAPNTKVYAVDTTIYHNAGASNVHELALAMSTGVQYMRKLIDRGVDVNDAAKSIWFTFSVGANFFMEIAKLRAFKMLWSKIVIQFGGNEEAQKAYIHADTSWRTNTKYDPYVNMLRNASQAFSAIVGGISSLNVMPFSNKHTAPDEFANRTARNTQNVLNEEAHLKDAIDPAGGSYYVETITGQLAEAAWEYFRHIEKETIGDLLKNGSIQKDIKEVAEARNKNLATRRDVILGTNKYPNMAEKEITVHEMSEKEISELVTMISDNYKNATKVMLSGVEDFDKMIATLGKGAYVVDVAYAVYSIACDACFTIHPIKPTRPAELFEQLRDAATAFEVKNGAAPVVHLACYGLLRQYKPRADFSADFFQTGGFKIETVDGFENAEAIIEGMKKVDTKAMVICSTDPQYEEFVVDFAKAMKAEKPATKLILAGYPKDKVEEYKAAGVDEFIHVKANIYEVLKELHDYYTA